MNRHPETSRWVAEAFDGCSRECRRKMVHTKVWGLCEKGIRPEPYVLIPREANIDGEIYTEWVQAPVRNLIPWITSLPVGAQIDCLSEIASAADEDREGVVYGWKSTAHVHEDPELLASLGRPFDMDEYQDAPRPEDPEGCVEQVNYDIRRRIQGLARYIATHDDPACDRSHRSRAEEERCDFGTQTRYRHMRELIDRYFGEGLVNSENRFSQETLEEADRLLDQVITQAGQNKASAEADQVFGTSMGVPITEDVIERAVAKIEADADVDQPVMVEQKIIHAPWTAEQVLSINAYQLSGKMHPFTCHYTNHPNLQGEHVTMIATPQALRCPQCDYHQFWVHAFMAAWPTDEEVTIAIQEDEEVTVSVDQAARILGVPVEAIFHLLENERIEYAPEDPDAPAGHRRLKLETLLVHKFNQEAGETIRAEKAAMLDDDIAILTKATWPDTIGHEIAEAALTSLHDLSKYHVGVMGMIAAQMAVLLNHAEDLGIVIQAGAGEDFTVDTEVGGEVFTLDIKPDDEGVYKVMGR